MEKLRLTTHRGTVKKIEVGQQSKITCIFFNMRALLIVKEQSATEEVCSRTYLLVVVISG